MSSFSITSYTDECIFYFIFITAYTDECVFPNSLYAWVCFPYGPMRVSTFSLTAYTYECIFPNGLHMSAFGMAGFRVQELCESRGGRPALSVLMSLTVSVDVKQHWTMLRHWSQFVPNMSTDIRGHEALHHHHGRLKAFRVRRSWPRSICQCWLTVSVNGSAPLHCLMRWDNARKTTHSFPYENQKATTGQRGRISAKRF